MSSKVSHSRCSVLKASVQSESKFTIVMASKVGQISEMILIQEILQLSKFSCVFLDCLINRAVLDVFHSGRRFWVCEVIYGLELSEYQQIIS